MSLDGTYSGLVDTVQNWIARTDIPASDLIALAEEDLNKWLRLRCMQTSGQITVSSTPIALPTDWLEYRALTYTTPPFSPLSVVPEQWANEHDYYWAYYTNPPPHYTIEGLNLRLATLNAGSWTLDTTYYQKLSLQTQLTNAVFVKYPSLYLFGALNVYLTFNGADERGEAWTTGYVNSKNAAITDDARAKFSGSTLVQRVRRAP